MTVKIKIPEAIRDKTNGGSSVDVSGVTVRECLGALIHRYPALEGEVVDGRGLLLLKWLISVNGQIVTASDELSYTVKEGDVIALVPMISGG